MLSRRRNAVLVIDETILFEGSLPRREYLGDLVPISTFQAFGDQIVPSILVQASHVVQADIRGAADTGLAEICGDEKSSRPGVVT